MADIVVAGEPDIFTCLSAGLQLSIAYGVVAAILELPGEGDGGFQADQLFQAESGQQE